MPLFFLSITEKASWASCRCWPAHILVKNVVTPIKHMVHRSKIAMVVPRKFLRKPLFSGNNMLFFLHSGLLFMPYSARIFLLPSLPLYPYLYPPTRKNPRREHWESEVHARRLVSKGHRKYTISLYLKNSLICFCVSSMMVSRPEFFNSSYIWEPWFPDPMRLLTYHIYICPKLPGSWQLHSGYWLYPVQIQDIQRKLLLHSVS